MSEKIKKFSNVKPDLQDNIEYDPITNQVRIVRAGLYLVTIGGKTEFRHLEAGDVIPVPELDKK